MQEALFFLPSECSAKNGRAASMQRCEEITPSDVSKSLQTGKCSDGFINISIWIFYL